MSGQTLEQNVSEPVEPGVIVGYCPECVQKLLNELGGVLCMECYMNLQGAVLRIHDYIDVRDVNVCTNCRTILSSRAAIVVRNGPRVLQTIERVYCIGCNGEYWAPR